MNRGPNNVSNGPQNGINSATYIGLVIIFKL
jgi:hypothetical protein